MREVDRRGKYSRRIFPAGCCDRGSGRRRCGQHRDRHRGCVGRRCDHAAPGDLEDAGERSRATSIRTTSWSTATTSPRSSRGTARRRRTRPSRRCLKTASGVSIRTPRTGTRSLTLKSPGKPTASCCCRASSRPISSRRSAPILLSRSTTRKSCGRNSATRARPPSMAATSSAVSTTSTGCRKSRRLGTKQSGGHHGKIRSER